MYKSSPFTFVFKFFFPVFMLAGIIFAIYMLWIEGTPESQKFAEAITVIAVFTSVFIIQIPFRLMSIETTNQRIIINDFRNKTSVDYKDIDWVSKYDLSSPWFVTIKYRVKETGEPKKISFIPNKKDQRFFANDAMTEFIKNKIISENENYSKDLQPSKVKNFIIIMFLNLLVYALILYYVDGSTIFF